jgi:ribosomal protein S18 acetylase RimI-like enzyme
VIDEIVKVPPGVELRHAGTREELAACFPVIAALRPFLRSETEWCDRAVVQAEAGYRVLAAWDGDRVLAVAGYRILENLIHGRFLYVDDLVTAEAQRGRRLGAALLQELSAIGRQRDCRRLVLDTAAANTKARRFYKREGLHDVVIGFIKPLGPAI